MGASQSASSSGKCCRPCLAQGGSSTPRGPRQESHKAWVRLQTDGKGPSPRSGHDVVVVDNKAYLFGGCGGEHEAINCLDDMYVFDMKLHHWDRVAGKGGVTPTARASFGMCAGTAPGTIVVAGGTGVEMDSLRGDILEFDARTRQWSKQLMTDADKTPCQFYGQSACRYGEVLLLFGGSTGLHYSNDLFEYNVRSGKWRKLVTTGRKPSPRYKHQAVVVGDCMYVIGGGCFKPEQSIIDLYCLDLKTLAWGELEMKGEIPKARVAHSCSYDPVGEDVYLWGGFTSELSRLQDFYAFHVPTATWRHIEADDKACPPARAFHCAVFHDGALYLFSGANGDVRYSDVWRYQVRMEVPSLAVLAARVLREGTVPPRKDAVLRVPQELLWGVQHMNEYATQLC